MASNDQTSLSLEGQNLEAQFRRSFRRETLRTLLLIAPLFVFVMMTFIVPIGYMLVRSVDNSIVPETFPRTVDALEVWSEEDGSTPPESVYEAFVLDLREAVEVKTHTRVGQRLNYERSGMSSLFRKTGRGVRGIEEGPYKAALIEVDDRWGDPVTWRLFKNFSGNYTSGYFLASADLSVDNAGDIVRVEPERRIYVRIFIRTIILSIIIAAATLVIGYPVAYLIANSASGTGNLLLILVLLPFWTSLLVRTSAWKVLLQQQGVINDLFVFFGLIADDARLTMINNTTGTLIAMTHILLPFMILPIYSVMRSISPSYVSAARSLGAPPMRAFWTVYFPNCLPGIGAGLILVFILSIGYYITPELVGGRTGIFISNSIAHHISSTLNWGLAAALGVLLLGLVLVIYWIYDYTVGFDRISMR